MPQLVETVCRRHHTDKVFHQCGFFYVLSNLSLQASDCMYHIRKVPPQCEFFYVLTKYSIEQNIYCKYDIYKVSLQCEFVHVSVRVSSAQISSCRHHIQRASPLCGFVYGQKIFSISKCLLINITCIRFLACVCPFMRSEVACLFVSLLTQITFVRLLSGVCLRLDVVNLLLQASHG